VGECMYGERERQEKLADYGVQAKFAVDEGTFKNPKPRRLDRQGVGLTSK